MHCWIHSCIWYLWTFKSLWPGPICCWLQEGWQVCGLFFFLNVFDVVNVIPSLETVHVSWLGADIPFDKFKEITSTLIAHFAAIWWALCAPERRGTKRVMALSFSSFFCWGNCTLALTVQWWYHYTNIESEIFSEIKDA